MKDNEQQRTSKKKLIIPPLVGLIFMILVVATFNSQYLAGRFAYAFSSSDVPTSVNTPITPEDKPTPAEHSEPTLIIPKINVEAPTIIDDTISDEAGIQMALRDGVVHFPGTTLPGEKGNSVIIGHSSGALWRPGNFKFVFSLLEKLENDDIVYVDYDGIRYAYKVTDKKIVEPTEVSVLNQSDDNSLTLITCHPVGTNKQRLIITAVQIDPEPKKEPNPIFDNLNQPENNKDQLPSGAPKVWESLHDIL